MAGNVMQEKTNVRLPYRGSLGGWMLPEAIDVTTLKLYADGARLSDEYVVYGQLIKPKTAGAIKSTAKVCADYCPAVPAGTAPFIQVWDGQTRSVTLGNSFGIVNGIIENLYMVPLDPIEGHVFTNVPLPFDAVNQGWVLPAYSVRNIAFYLNGVRSDFDREGMFVRLRAPAVPLVTDKVLIDFTE